MNHTTNREEKPEDRCGCEVKYSIPFLDTLCSIVNGKIDTDLYKKPTDRNQYLLPNSCHPKQTTAAIPKSLGLRIVRICSDTKNRNKRLQEMKSQLLDRGYSESLVDYALDKVKKIPRLAALKQTNKQNQTRRPVFAVTYDPRLPSISSLQAKHWRSMVGRNQHLKEVFPSPPLTAFRRQPNLRSFLIRASLPQSNNRNPQRT